MKLRIAAIALLAVSSAAFAGPPIMEQQIATLQSNVAALQTEVVALRNQLNVVKQNNALKLGPFVDVDLSPEYGVIGPNVVFHGVNVHIVNGTAPITGGNIVTGFTNGLGNLIIGYDFADAPQITSARNGSHNLVLGNWNRWTQKANGAIISGDRNLVDGPWSAIIGSYGCYVSGGSNSILNGYTSVVTGNRNTVVGGISVGSSGDQDVLIGGSLFNTANSNSIIIWGPTALGMTFPLSPTP
jgi:hypothetical protein